MNRYALLIESSSVKGLEDLPGARRDMVNWKKHLKNNFAGAWNDNEIRELSKPTTGDLSKWIAHLNTMDFAIVVFSGHGYRDKGQDYICLNDFEQSVHVSYFQPSCRSIVVLDACRGVEETQAVALSTSHASNSTNYSFLANSVNYAKLAEAANEIQLQNRYRLFYESELQKINGRVVLQSCAVGEAAGENPLNGGYYTTSLLRSARKWHEVRKDLPYKYILPIYEANSLAIADMRQRNIFQSPQMTPYMQGGSLPFAIKPN